MKTITFSESRANYAQTLDAVINDREEVVVTRVGHEPVVIVSLEVKIVRQSHSALARRLRDQSCVIGLRRCVISAR